MDDYISKQSVIDYLKGYLNSIGECGADSLLFDRGQRRALINSIQDISVIKGADVQPIKHGRWIVTKTERGWNCAEYPVEWTCSECKVANDRKDDFCPHCGSYNRMDGDSDE